MRLKTALRAVASFQADVVLTVFYYLALAPAALLVKLARIDLLGLRETTSGWRTRETVDPAEHLKNQG